jgi:hypothetical protein
VGHTLAVADKLVGSTGNDKVDVLAELKQRIHSISGCDKLNRVVGDLRALKCLGNNCSDDLERFC